MNYEYCDFLVALHEEKEFLTYAELAKKYGVNQYYLWKMLNDEEYRPPKSVCVILGINYYVDVPICKICGIAHTYDCTAEKAVPLEARVIQPGKPRKRAPRVEIALSDPAKARAKLEKALKEYSDD